MKKPMVIVRIRGKTYEALAISTPEVRTPIGPLSRFLARAKGPGPVVVTVMHTWRAEKVDQVLRGIARVEKWLK